MNHTEPHIVYRMVNSEKPTDLNVESPIENSTELSTEKWTKILSKPPIERATEKSIAISPSNSPKSVIFEFIPTINDYQL